MLRVLVRRVFVTPSSPTTGACSMKWARLSVIHAVTTSPMLSFPLLPIGPGLCLYNPPVFPFPGGPSSQPIGPWVFGINSWLQKGWHHVLMDADGHPVFRAPNELNLNLSRCIHRYPSYRLNSSCCSVYLNRNE